MANTYDTSQFPLGSTDAKVLYNNAGNADIAVNSVDALTWIDRPPFNRVRKTWHGIEVDANNALLNTGFEFIGDYDADGPLTITRLNQTFSHDGEFWRPSAALVLPFTTTGVWATDLPNFVNNGDASLRSDLGNQTNAAKGAALIGYVGRDVAAKFQERIDVTDHFVAGDPNWSNAIDRCIAIAEAAASSNLAPNFVVPRIWFPRLDAAGTTYTIDRPIFCTLPPDLDGDGARITPVPGFVGATIPLQAGGTEVNSSMLICLNGNKLNTGGTLRWRAHVGSGLIFDCADIASNGIYIERMPYSQINCVIRGCLNDGVQVGPFCWGLGSNGIVIESYTDYGMHFLKDSVCNGMTIMNPRIWGQFKTSKGGLLFDQDAEANGVLVSGGFIEKLDYGVLIGAGNGPMDIAGVDFEQCTFNVVRAAAGIFTGQKIGPINVTNCFLNSKTVASGKIYADHATVNVQGCRMFPGSVDFETDATHRGIINAKDNRYMNGDTIGLATNVTLAYEQNDGVTKQYRNYLPHKASSFLPVFDVRNYQFGDAPQLQSSGFNFYSDYTGGGTGQYVGRSDWWISEYQHVTAPGVLNKTIGVRLANDSGQNSFQPMFNNVTQCGAAGAVWAGGATQVAFTVTSDARMKQHIKSLTQSELAVAVKLKCLLRSFKLNSQVEEFGDKAKIHVGVIAQDVIAAFKDEGLNALDYEIVSYSEWNKSENVEAGNLYSVNYEQLLAFIISAM